ncbi:MAG: OmpA/MotB family protein [Phycisphaerae bacterium]
MAHKPPPPPEEEKGESAPLWIISFADLVTLMLSFFVILAAGNNKKAEEIDPNMTELAAAIRTAFKYLPPVNSKDPVDMQILLNSLKNQRGKGGAGSKGEARRPLEGAVGLDDRVTTIRTGTQSTMGGAIPFERDSAEIPATAVPTLNQILSAMRGHTNVFVVKGHTSRDEEYRLRGSDRDLAYERANAVIARLISMGVAKETLRAQSCRDYEPRVERAYSEAAHAMNRRVEVIATEELVSELRGDPKEIVPGADESPAGRLAH